MDITEPIRRLARLEPATPAIVRADGTVINYAALERGINRMAAHAARLGLRAGDTATLNVSPPDEAPALILLLALAQIGVTTTDPGLPGHQGIAFQAAGSRVVASNAMTFDASWLEGNTPPEATPHDDASAPCRVFASSGTTGRPESPGQPRSDGETRVFALSGPVGRAGRANDRHRPGRRLGLPDGAPHAVDGGHDRAVRPARPDRTDAPAWRDAGRRLDAGVAQFSDRPAAR